MSQIFSSYFTSGIAHDLNNVLAPSALALRLALFGAGLISRDWFFSRPERLRIKCTSATENGVS
jgi:hypothetical protein